MMTYQKPLNVKYTDMAIYIDKHIYDEDKPKEVEDTIYKYMYLLFYMFASKHKYFQKDVDYDGYAKFCATRLYMRYLRVEKKVKNPKLKSSLNYIKSVKFGWKIRYQNENFKEIINADTDRRIDPIVLHDNLTNEIQNDFYAGIDEAIISEIKYFPRSVMSIIKETPYKDDEVMCKNLYISCMLTVLSSLTLSNEEKRRLKLRLDANCLNDNLVFKFYERERRTDAILWNLDKNMNSLVMVLSNKIRKTFSNYINDIKQSFELTDDTIKAIISGEINKYDDERYDDE